MALIVVVLSPLSPAGARASGHAPVIVTAASPGSPVAPGGLGVADVVVANDVDVPTGVPVTLAFALPPGVTLDAVTSPSAADAWACSGTTCTLTDALTGQPAPLDGEDSRAAHLAISLSPSTNVGSGLSVGVAASAAAAPGGADPDHSRASATITFPPLAAGRASALDVGDDSPGIFFPGEAAVVTTTIRNLGPGSIGGSQNSVTITGVLPPGSRDWRASGSGWSCQSRAGLPECTWTGPAIGTGGRLADLVVEFLAPTALTTDETPVTWVRRVTALAGKKTTRALAEEALAAHVVERPAPRLAIEADPPTPFSLEPPGSVAVPLRVSGRHLAGAPGVVSLSAELPAGVRFSAASGAGWSCGPAGQPLACTRAADFGEEPVSELAVTLDVGPEAAAGLAALAFTAHLDAEPVDQRADNTAVSLVLVGARPPAAASLRAWTYGTGGTPRPTDGSAYRLAAGAATAVGIDALNGGSAPIPAGTELTLTLTLPPATAAATSTDTPGPVWACTLVEFLAVPSLSCRVTTTAEVPLDGALPRLRADLTASAATPAGTHRLTASLSAARAGSPLPELSSSMELGAEVDQAPAAPPDPGEAGLAPRAAVEAEPRVGGEPGTIVLSAANHREERSRPVIVTATLPEGLSLLEPLPAKCGRQSHRQFGVTVACGSFPPLHPGESSPPVALRVAAGPGTPSPATVGVGAWAPGDKEPLATMALDVAVLPALSAVASATPEVVTNAPFGAPQPRVLLDGEASEAAGADLSWRQTPAPGEPVVVFEGVDPGATVVHGPSAAFAAPVVEAETALHFELTVSDGRSSAVAGVTVVVRPVPAVPPGGTTGWEDQVGDPPAGGTALSFFGIAAATEPGWTWTRDPAVQLNRVERDTPVQGSRLTLLDNGDIAFSDPTDPPPDTAVTHEWLECGPDFSPSPPLPWSPDACTSLGTATFAIPRTDGHHAVLRMTVSSASRSLSTTRDFGLGEIAFGAGDPGLLSPPFITPSEPEVDTTLTADPGQWTLEHGFSFQWRRCPAPTPDACTDIPGAAGQGQTYVVTLDDVGHVLRVFVIAHARGEGNFGNALSPPTAAVPEDDSQPLAVTTDLVGGTDSIPNSASRTVHGSATGGRGAITFQWVQLAGPTVVPGPVGGPDLTFTAPATGTGDLVFRLTATDASGASAQTTITVTFGVVPVPGVLCTILDEARAAGSGARTITLGSAMSLTFSGATISPGECSASTTLAMDGATLDLFGWLRVTGLRVHIDPEGVQLDGGVLTAPGDPTLAGMDFRVVTSGLAIPFEGADLRISGSVLATNLPFLRLPPSWEAAAKISFSSDSAGGVQTVGFGAVAWDTSAPGSPSRPADDLPVPPAGAPRLGLSGSASTDRSLAFALTASRLVTFGSSGLAFSGSVSRTGAGPTTITASASLAGPVTLAPGIVLAAASLGWDGSAFTGSGELAVSANGGSLSVAAQFAFADARDWSATLSLSAPGGAGSWTPVDGLRITAPSVTGSMARNGPTSTFDLEVRAASVTVAREATLDNLVLDLHAQCSPSCTPVMQASGEVRVGVASPPVTAGFAGQLDLGSGAFSITAALADLTPFEGLTVRRVAFAMAGGAGTTTSVRLEGSARVLGLDVTVQIALSGAGFFVKVELGNWLPGRGAPSFSGAAVVYSSFDTQTTVGGETVPVPARTVLLTARTGAPRWFTDLLGVSSLGQMTVVGDVNLATRDFSVAITINPPGIARLFDVGGVSQTLDRIGFTVESRGGTITTGFTAQGKLRLPGFGAGTPPSELDVDVTAAYDPVIGRLSGAVTARGDWVDAFGVRDLTVSNLAVQISLERTSASLGLAGTVVLPSAWSAPIGIAAGTPVTLVASVGASSPCFKLQVGDPQSRANVVDVANAGALTAKFLSIVIAPTGCQVGTQTLPAGMSLFFDGSVLGTSVKVTAELTPAPFSFHADVQIGEVSVSGFTLRSARVVVDWSPLVKGISVQARAEVLGVTADVSGQFARTPTGTSAAISGVFRAPDLGGFRLDRLEATFDFQQSGATRTISASAEADVSVLGVPQHVAFAFTVSNGRIDQAEGTATITIPINTVTISGTGQFRFTRGQFPDISLTGQVAVGDLTLSSLSGRLNRGGLTVDVSLNVAAGFSTTPRLSGTVAWASDGSSTIKIRNQAGQEVDARPGDFRFDADNVGLAVSGFGLQVDVTVARVGTDAWAKFAAEVNLGAGEIRVAGDFDRHGNFTLQAAAALKLSNFQLPSGRVLVARQGGTFTVSADITFAVPKLASVRFQGTFTRSTSAGLLYDLRGSAAIQPGGFNFGSGEFRLFRQASGLAGMTARASINVPGFTGSGDLAIGSDGTLSLSASLDMGGTIGQVLGFPRANVSYLNRGTTNEFSFSVTVRDVMGLPGSVYVSGTTSSNGSYSVRVSATAGPWKDKLDLGLCTARYRAGGSFDGSISGTANSLTITIDATLSASAGCGSLKASIRVDVDFEYTPPARFSLKIKLVLKFGDLPKWKPTIYKS